VERQAFSRRRIQHHHLLGYFKHRNARFSRCGKTVLHIRTTHNSQAAETKRFLRTGEARSRSINLKARALAIASRPSVSANLAGSPRSGKRPPSSAPRWINLWTRGRFCIGSALLSYRCRGFVGGACRTIAAQTSKHAGLTRRGHRASASAALGSMAAAWKPLVAIGDPPSPPENCVVVERLPPLADRLIKISNPCQWWIRQVEAYISKCRALIPFYARTLSIYPFIQIMVRARRYAGRAAALVRALF